MPTTSGNGSRAKAAAPLTEYLADLRQEIEDGLSRALAAIPAPAIITGPMAYALLAAGKRLRPCLTLAAAEAAGVPLGLSAADARAVALPAAVAIEMIHTYSLVHDDLPAMDDDALRRGQPTVHVVYGDGLAVLVGDGLLTEAFGVLAHAPSAASPAGAPTATAERRLRAIARLAAAAGAMGMVGGQAIDLAAAGRVPNREAAVSDPASLADMHARKTGALIRAATVMGAELVGAPNEVIAAIDDYARDLGLAFQIIDDVLDVEGSDDALGKTAGKDAAAGKTTYPSLYGVAESRALAARSVARAHAALGRVNLSGDRLGQIALWSLAPRA